MAAGLGGQGAAGTWIGTGRERRFDRLSALSDLLVREGRQREGWLEGKQGCGAPGTLPRLGAVVLIVVAVRMAQLGQALRVALTGEDGLEHGHAGHAGERTDDVGELAMHRCSGLVPMLQRVGGVGQAHLPMPQGAAPHAHVGVRPQGASEEPVGMPAVQPLAIAPIRLRSAGDTLGVAGIDQAPLHAPGLSQCQQGKPVDPGGLHGDGGDATGEEPVGAGVEGSGAGAATAHGLGVAPRGHGNPVLGLTNVDARGVGVVDWKGVGEHG